MMGEQGGERELVKAASKGQRGGGDCFLSIQKYFVDVFLEFQHAKIY